MASVGWGEERDIEGPKGDSLFDVAEVDAIPEGDPGPDKGEKGSILPPSGLLPVDEGEGESTVSPPCPGGAIFVVLWLGPGTAGGGVGGGVGGSAFECEALEREVGRRAAVGFGEKFRGLGIPK